MKIAFRSKKAASLVEMAIAMILLVIVVLCAFNYYAGVVNFAVKAENYNTATEFLAEILNTLFNYKYSDFALSTGTYPWVLTGALKDKYGGAGQYAVSAETKWDDTWADTTTNGYKEITASITWNDGAAKTLTLSSRKTK